MHILSNVECLDKFLLFLSINMNINVYMYIYKHLQNQSCIWPLLERRMLNPSFMSMAAESVLSSSLCTWAGLCPMMVPLMRK